jgi:hypothetical protein
LRIRESGVSHPANSARQSAAAAKPIVLDVFMGFGDESLDIL